MTDEDQRRGAAQDRARMRLMAVIKQGCEERTPDHCRTCPGWYGNRLYIPEDWQPPPLGPRYAPGVTPPEPRLLPDWHAGMLREVARQLGFGHDLYFMLIGASRKLDDYKRGMSYAEAAVVSGKTGSETICQQHGADG